MFYGTCSNVMRFFSKAILEIISDQVLFNVFSIENDFFCLKVSKMIEI